MPYDRPFTVMAAFPQSECDSEYRDPYDRRFYAQPAAPTVAGRTHLEWLSQHERKRKEAVLQAAVAQLNAGGIIAVSWLVSHLACDGATLTQWRCCGRVNIVRRNHWR